MKPLLSVIMPVYNAGGFLERSVKSILAQTFTSFELILIDDGSTDGSGQLCDKFALDDLRIKVFHKKNEGVGLARQFGLDKSIGDYITFVDSDDWCTYNMFEAMYKSIVKSKKDMMIFDYIIDLGYKEKRIGQKPNNEASDIVEKNILDGKIMGALWNKIIKREAIKKTHAHFIKNINYCEDVLFCIQLLQNKITVGYCPEAFYHYSFLNTNSITRKYTQETFEMRKRYLEMLSKMLRGTSVSSSIKMVALEIKFEAFRNGILSYDDFLSFYPTTFRDIFISNEKTIYKVCFILCKFNLYSYSTYLLKYYELIKKCIKKYVKL